MIASQRPFVTTTPFILGSGSPRRRELLHDLGLDFDVHSSTAEEPAPDTGEAPLNYVKRMAELKTLEVASRFSGRTVLGADTIVVLGDRIMGKPKDEEHALEMLTALSGKTHQVITGFCIVLQDGTKISQSVSTDVVMRQSTREELLGYIATGEPSDKAGAYAIQGIGTFLVTAISGSYTNVVGLPVSRVLEELKSNNVVRPAISQGGSL